MDWSLMFELTNLKMPYEILVLTVSLVVSLVESLANEKQISGMWQLLLGTIVHYVKFHIVIAFFYLSAPIVKDFRCEIIQEPGNMGVLEHG